MDRKESEARRLAASLTVQGFAAAVDGVDHNWHVDVGPVGGRSLRVTCFWYDRELGALMLGMNPANARSALRVKCRSAPYRGREFAIDLIEAESPIVSGRTRTMGDVNGCVRAWLSGASLDDLVRQLPFVDEGPRALRAIGGSLDPRLRWDIVQGAVWAYADGRSCKLDVVSCAFLVGPARVAFTSESRDVSGDVAAWLLDRVPLAVLAGRGVQIERHAHVLEIDPPRWHWLHMRDRIANPRDVLAPLAPLIELLAASPIASRFYTLSSLFFLRFSASSHCPFVDLDLAIAPAANGEVYVNDARCPLGEAIAKIEAVLSASVIEPFFGAKDEVDCRLITESLSRRGNALRPEIVQCGGYNEIWLRVSQRSCRVTDVFLHGFDADGEFTVFCADPDDVVEQALRYLHDAAEIADLAATVQTIQYSGRVGQSRKRVDTAMTKASRQLR
jgi:hypothetical protein